MQHLWPFLCRLFKQVLLRPGGAEAEEEGPSEVEGAAIEEAAAEAEAEAVASTWSMRTCAALSAEESATRPTNVQAERETGMATAEAVTQGTSAISRCT